ncbi:uncharacterized protein LOC122664012 isoform X2 [Telopea speciosissima]|uniref:uncharacterized protein LOC122664012 isoform X2 n=1 Tax=Telopea speciosissima TaxID=54955 RepID=UPI001CC79B0E|nr:uncharacterized protein LOC122664012 isoform X2 [Telopea speciosissima]
MAYLSSDPGSESRRRKPFPIEQRPQMLKDFLMDDFSSCSSNGFRSFPRHACRKTVRNLVEMDLKSRDSNHYCRLMRSRSKAASKTISAFHKASEVVMNVVKHLPFSSMKAPSQPKSQTKQGILPRSLSRRLRRSFWKKRDVVENYSIKDIKVRVMIKDIIRWKSFRDLIEEKQQQPLDFSPSPLQISSIAAVSATTADGDTTTITTNSSISSNNSKSNSWSESDFTSEYLQSSGGSSEYSGDESKECSGVEKKMTSNGGHNAIREDSMETTTNSVDPKGDCTYEEKKQFSPVSVLDFPEEEDDDGETETPSSFHQSLANMERTKQKLMHKIRRFESLAQLEPVDLGKRIALLEKDDSGESSSQNVSQEDEDEEQECEVEPETKMAEGRALELLKLMKTTSSLEGWTTTGNLDGVLLDFLKERITGTAAVAEEADGFDYKEVVKVARAWVNEKPFGGMALGLEYNRETYVREMESEEGRWRKFEEEQSELAMEVENGVLGSLVDELLVDLFS